MTQRQAAVAGKITRVMQQAARAEGVDPEVLRHHLVEGTLVLPANKRHKWLKPLAIGQDVRVKVNANIGTSPHAISLEKELAKQAAALEHGADTIMDLSTGGPLDLIRTNLLADCPAPFGTVPIYQVMVEANNLEEVKADWFLDIVHCGVSRAALPLLKKRVTGVVSRGGAFTVAWMRRHGQENPLLAQYDKLLQIAREYDVTLSLGDGLRPGSLADATDRAQLHELKLLGELTKRAWAKGVQVMVEGPGHLPLQAIKKNMRLQQKYCANAPF
jgi:phosphomethylpyrimidine synthase